jgi:hypothetical protein
METRSSPTKLIAMFGSTSSACHELSGRRYTSNRWLTHPWDAYEQLCRKVLKRDTWRCQYRGAQKKRPTFLDFPRPAKL